MATTETLPTDLDHLSDRLGRPEFPGCRPVHLPRAEIACANEADFLAAIRR